MFDGSLMRLLGIETSCDETAAAVVDAARGGLLVRANVVLSQIPLHAATGGVVPEVAAREHCVHIAPVVQRALRQAHATPRSISALAVTAGPGLMTSLTVGVEAARTLAYLWKKPLIPVNHIEGHVAGALLQNPAVRYPALALVVSGGHTELLLMAQEGWYRCIGRTLDDAAGEAFDKVAKLLRLPYPGGPAIAELAERGKTDAYTLPRPMLDRTHFDFSFAGIKTAALYLVQGIPGRARRRIRRADLAASFQQAVIDVLVGKTIRAARQYGAKSVMLAGGVAANGELRTQLQAAVEQALPHTKYFQPALAYCTDNAAMIAARGAQLFALKKHWPWQRVHADPNWEMW